MADLPPVALNVNEMMNRCVDLAGEIIRFIGTQRIDGRTPKTLEVLTALRMARNFGVTNNLSGEFETAKVLEDAIDTIVSSGGRVDA